MERIVCKGLNIENVLLPKFAVNDGEAVCIRWPVRWDHPAVGKFNRLLQHNTSDLITVTGRVCFAEQTWWETTLLGVNCRHFPDRHFPATWLHPLRERGWLREFLIWDGIKVPLSEELGKRLDRFRSPAGSLILESSERKLISCLLCESPGSITIFDQRRCTPGKLINHLEYEDIQNTIIEYRFVDSNYPIDNTYRSARIIDFQAVDNFDSVT